MPKLAPEANIVPTTTKLPVDVLTAPPAFKAPPPVQLPVMLIVPLLKLMAPEQLVEPPLPPIQSPVMLIMPLLVFQAPGQGPKVFDPPVQFPVMLIVPLPEFAAPAQVLEFPAQFPIIFIVPLERLLTAIADEPAGPPVAFPIIVQLCPVVSVEAKQFIAPVLPDSTPAPVNVNVTPLTAVKPPPAVTPVVDPLRILRTVVVVLAAMVKLLAQTSSADVGNAPVFQTVGSDQLPDLTA